MRFWPFGSSGRGKQEALDGRPTAAETQPLDGRPTAAEKHPRSGAPGGPGAPPEPPSEEHALVQRMRKIDLEGELGRIEAGQVLQASRGTPFEARVVDVLLDRLGGVAAGDALRVQTALVLVDRGDVKRAEDLVGTSVSARGLFMAAELAEARGELPLALTRLERVLAREVDYPGARERHQRLRAALGLVQNDPKRGGVTALVPQADAPYKLLREVARGGAGAVYEAEDPVLARSVALKMLHDPAGQGDALLHEMRVTAELAGDGVIRVYDADAAEGWLAFEWAPGGSLRDALRAKAALLAHATSWLPQVAAALARIHQRGYVHADVKPANLLFLRDDLPVFSDFGIARAIGAELLGGSMGYVTPDRLKKTLARPWHDVYGFGRLVEEVAASPVCPPHDHERLQGIVRACVGEEAQAPRSGAELVVLVQSALSSG